MVNFARIHGPKIGNIEKYNDYGGFSRKTVSILIYHSFPSGNWKLNWRYVSGADNGNDHGYLHKRNSKEFSEYIG